MCGIAGQIANSNPNFRPSRVLNEFSHRGPDAQQDTTLTIDEKYIWFGHTRLSILDLSEAGAQPMYSDNQEWIIVFNGEIYNHLSLRANNHCYRGHSDTETIVELLATYGVEKTLPQLNGMYAFAALNRVQGKL